MGEGNQVYWFSNRNRCIVEDWFVGSELWIGSQLVSEGNLRTRGSYGLVVVYAYWSNKF